LPPARFELTAPGLGILLGGSCWFFLPVQTLIFLRFPTHINSQNPYCDRLGSFLARFVPTIERKRQVSVICCRQGSKDIVEIETEGTRSRQKENFSFGLFAPCLKKFWASLRCSDVFFVFRSQDLPSPKRRLKAACPRQIYQTQCEAAARVCAAMASRHSKNKRIATHR
jgi:hypothetical protein